MVPSSPLKSVACTGEAASARHLQRLVRVGLFVALLLATLVANNRANADGSSEALRSRPYASQLYVSLTPSSMSQVEAIWQRASVVISPEVPAVVEHHVAIDAVALRALQAAGIHARVLDPDLQRLVDESYARWLTPSQTGYAGGLPAWFNQVQPLTAIYALLDEMAKDAPERVSVSVVGKAYENDIKVIRISSAATDGDRATVLVTGTHHAREWISPMVVMGYAWSLVEQYDSDPAVRKAVDNLNIYIVPVQNPDSYIRTFSGDRLRRTNQSPSCRDGVDLNRNWPAKDWSKNTGACGTETYCGPRATSEPETQATKSFGDSLTKPVLYVDVHSGGNAVMIPYAANNTRPKMYAQAKAAAETYGSLVGLTAEAGIIIAQGGGGGAFDYFQESWDEKRGIAFVVELPPGRANVFDVPSEGIPSTVEKHIKGLVTVLEKLADENPASTGVPQAGDAGMIAAADGGMGGPDVQHPAGQGPSANDGAASGATAAGAASAVDASAAMPGATSAVAGSDPGATRAGHGNASGDAGRGTTTTHVRDGAAQEQTDNVGDTSGCSVLAVGIERSDQKLALAAVALAFAFLARRRRAGAQRAVRLTPKQKA